MRKIFYIFVLAILASGCVTSGNQNFVDQKGKPIVTGECLNGPNNTVICQTTNGGTVTCRKMFGALSGRFICDNI